MPDRPGVATLLIAAGARSRGRLTLGSADPGARPVIDPAYRADERDLDIAERAADLILG
jgi:choline dehydrogenase-like flavoprotein